MPMLGAPFLLMSGAAGLAYGTVLQFRPVSVFRTVVKTLAVSALALWAYLAGAPPLLTAALGLSAVGDAFLAGDPKRWLPFGLGSFLIAHILYVGLFLEIGGLGILQHEPIRWLGGGVALVCGAGLMLWLWRDLGALRGAVVAYMLAIVAMVTTVFSLDPTRWNAMVGAVAFMASDAILSWRLFRVGERADVPLRAVRLADHAVWWLYWGGQLGIALSFLI